MALLGSFALLASVACRPAASPADPDEGLSCEERQARLVAVLHQLPERSLTTPVRVNLPRSELGRAVGSGPILELSPSGARLDGEPLGALDEAATAPDFRNRIEQQLAASIASAPVRSPESGTEGVARTLYVAAAWDTDVRTLHEYLTRVPESIDVQLLFSVVTKEADSKEQGHREIAERVLAEPDPAKRAQLARNGYEQYSSCDAVEQAVRSVEASPLDERWPRLRGAMLRAVPQCDCSDLDASSLRHLLAAEQRAGSVAVGAVPISFARDERCRASMPLTSMQTLIEEIEEFDADFSGEWKDGVLHMDKALSTDRLLNYLCVASAGETLAELQRHRRTLYFRPPGSSACQAFRFEPQARGAPMGTWRRVEPAGLPPLALHYRQAVEEIRLFGPVPTPQSRATDPGPWGCSQDFRMSEVDSVSIQLQSGGSWFFSEAACRASPSNAAFSSGCIGSLLTSPDPSQVIAPEPAPVEPASSGTAPSVESE